MGGGCFAVALKVCFDIPWGGTQKQMPSAFLTQPQKTIRLPGVPLGWQIWAVLLTSWPL